MNERNFIEFAKEIGKLKKIPRTGWVTQGKIKDPESVAEHSFRTAMLGMILAKDLGLNIDKVVKICLVHDIEEAVTGDITSIDKGKMDKVKIEKIEEDGVKKILKTLPVGIRGYVYEIWREYKKEETKEAKLVKIVDGLEMMIQAKEYSIDYPKNKNKLELFLSKSPKLKFLEKDAFAKRVLKSLRKFDYL